MGLVRLIQVVLAVALTSACASSGAVPKPFPGAPEAPAPEAPPAPEGTPAAAPVEAEPDAAPARAAAPAPGGGVVATALGLRGVPYRSGGSDPSGFDCSGFVQYVFAQHGVALPREVREQVRFGDEVRLAGIEAGDLIFFAIGERSAQGGASHVGLALGGDEFVHAPSARGVVRVEKFSAPYWARRLVEVRRITQP